jgi:hypothetical protein
VLVSDSKAVMPPKLLKGLSRRKPLLFHFVTDFWHFSDPPCVFPVQSSLDPNQPSEIVEFTVKGKFIGQASVDPAQGGAFGLNIVQYNDDQVRFAAVDDNANIITIWKLNTANLTDPAP